MKVGHFSNNDGVIIRPVEGNYAVEKLAVNKACGPDQMTAEHLKHAGTKI